MRYHFERGSGAVFISILLIASLFQCTAYNRAEMFNRQAADPDNRPDEVVKHLKIKPGDRVADLGAGGGYFTLRFAREVGEEGRVYAVDIEREYLTYITKSAERAKLNNIVTVLATERESGLEERSVDLIFIRNVFHHITEPVAYFRRLKRALRPGGRIAIVENIETGILMKIHGHTTTPEIIISTMEDAGYRVSERFDFLPDHSFTIFRVR